MCIVQCACCMQNSSMRLSPLVPLEQVNTNLQANHCYAAVAALTTICHLPALPTILPTTNCGPFPFLCLLTSFQINSMKMFAAAGRFYLLRAHDGHGGPEGKAAWQEYREFFSHWYPPKTLLRFFSVKKNTPCMFPTFCKLSLPILLLRPDNRKSTSAAVHVQQQQLAAII